MNGKLWTVYKIVRVDGDAYASISFSEGDPLHVRYCPGQWSYAPEEMSRAGYNLCVFTALSYALDFIAGCELPPGCEVWRCEAQDLRVPRVPSLGEPCATTILRALPVGAWPMGTVFARAVRLVERMPGITRCEQCGAVRWHHGTV
jgi:hypothetical protein